MPVSINGSSGLTGVAAIDSVSSTELGYLDGLTEPLTTSLAAKVAYVRQPTAPTGANGTIWWDTSSSPAVAKQWDGSAWVPFSGARATVSGTTGSPTIDTTSRPGKTIYKFTGSGSITIANAGYAECLIVGGGGGSGSPASGLNGSPGWVVYGQEYLGAGTITVTVGGGGAANGSGGGNSSISGVVTASGGGYSASGQTALSVASSITGTSVTYGGWATSSGSPANTGAAGGSPSGGHAGASGVVIIVVG